MRPKIKKSLQVTFTSTVLGLKSHFEKNGDPSLLLSERIYPIDFNHHYFKTRNRISLEDAKNIAEKYENGHGKSIDQINLKLNRA